MGSGKRAYVPKVKGCYECSQRRVHCDRSTPSCAKCISKGLQCSGLGIRYRFDGDKLPQVKNSKTASTTCDELCSLQTGLRGSSRFFPQQNPNGKNSALQAQYVGVPNCNWSQSRLRLPYQHYDNGDTDVENTGEPTPSAAIPTSHTGAVGETGLLLISPSETSKPWERHLLCHYAENIASELVVIDDQRNGWRHLILPLAHVDDLVMDTVLSAAAFHFWNTCDDRVYQADVIYTMAIRRLQERQNLEAQDTTSRQAVILSLLVLLSTVMVNGGTDFPRVLNLLESAVEAMGGEENLLHGELGLFVVRQVRKYRGYAAPLLSQSQGFARLSLTSSSGPGLAAVNGWECFQSSYQSHPELSRPLSIIYDLNKRACNIYVARVQAGSHSAPFTAMVEEFKQIMECEVTPGMPGEHTLVFATFIAAAESFLPEHREFFEALLLRHYRRNGFANIPVALQHLRNKIWASPPPSPLLLSASEDLHEEQQHFLARDWTLILPELQLFIV